MVLFLDMLTKAANLQVHSKNFNVGVQALMLLDKISSKNQIASDRFYRALYSKLLLPAAMNTSKARKLFFAFYFWTKNGYAYTVLHSSV